MTRKRRRGTASGWKLGSSGQTGPRLPTERQPQMPTSTSGTSSHSRSPIAHTWMPKAKGGELETFGASAAPPHLSG